MPLVKILLAEDDVDHQDLLVASLTDNRPHVTVDVVDRGQRVIEILHTAHAGQYDCAIFDFNLPDQNAAELLSHLKNRSSAHFPIIVVSSSNAQAVVIDCMRSGSVDFVPKSQALEGDTLWRRVELAITESQRKRENRRKIVRRSHQLAKLAEQDPLTGLYNRRFINHLFNKDRCKLDRRGQTSICMIDLDHFKAFNDQHGHACGDRVLIGVAEQVRRILRSHQIACRWGGEELLLVLQGVDLVEAVAMAEALRERIRRHGMDWHGQTLPITTSIGCYACAAAELGQDSLPQAIDRADQAMYLAKERGRDRVCTWEMVLFQQLVQQAKTRKNEPLQNQLAEVLKLGQDYLGPTQLDHLTGHSREVGELARELAGKMNLMPETRHRIHLAGLLHDLGKFVVPEAVLAKRKELTPTERQLVDTHASEGAQMSRSLGADVETASFIKHHHARFDTAAVSRRPGDAPPLGARIIAVAEAYSAMTSPHSYQPTRCAEDAIQEMQREQGRQFDPDVVDALVATLRQGRSRIGEVRGLVPNTESLNPGGASETALKPLEV